jgi:hypothetical protein
VSGDARAVIQIADPDAKQSETMLREAIRATAAIDASSHKISQIINPSTDYVPDESSGTQ